MAIPTFNYATWAVRFPELVSRAAQGTIESIAANDVPAFLDFDLFRDDEAPFLLNLATAHFVELNTPGGVSAGSQGLVGRVTSAGEGSVSLSLDAGPMRSSAQAFWAQTKYGYQLWLLTAQYRRFRYVPGFPKIARAYRMDNVP